MTVPTTSVPEPTQAEPTPATTSTPQGDPADLGDAGKRALDAERTARKAAEKAAAEATAQLKAIETAQLSDLEKAQRAAQDAQAAATKAEAEALRWRIAAQHQISDEDAQTFLNGADEATLTRQAERLAALRGDPSPAPRPDLTQGSGRDKPGATPETEFARFLTNQLAGK